MLSRAPRRQSLASITERTIFFPLHTYFLFFLFSPFPFDLLEFPQQLGGLVLFIVTVRFLRLTNDSNPSLSWHTYLLRYYHRS